MLRYLIARLIMSADDCADTIEAEQAALMAEWIQVTTQEEME